MQNLSRMLLLMMVFLLNACSSARPTPNSRSGLFGDLDSRASVVHRGVAPRSPASATTNLTPEQETHLMSGSHGLVWPLENVEITSSFGMRGSDAHEGVDLRAKVGTPVFASQSGTVVYAGERIRGYGKMLVIRHADHLATVYAHNSELKAKRGDKVLKGSLIALSGDSGNVTGPHLHFEVRYGLQSLNPEKLMLARQGVVKADQVAERTITPPIKRRKAKTKTARFVEKRAVHRTAYHSKSRSQNREIAARSSTHH